MTKILKTTAYAVTLLFAVIGIVFTAVFVGMRFGLFNISGSLKSHQSFIENGATVPQDGTETTYAWQNTPEWISLKNAIIKDQSVIQTVSYQTGVPARMIASVIVPEQIRYFTSNREVYKQFFEPLQILGVLSQFSLGISGIKMETAIDIEKHLKDQSSPMYLGPDFKHTLDYPEGTSHDAELYRRLTDTKDRYYQYLYSALFLKQITAQWQKSGYDIAHNPDVLVTIFNLGFSHSNPNANPQVGGAPITIGSQILTFGEIGSQFYNSNELLKEFPRE